jgi:hypothetical protein
VSVGHELRYQGAISMQLETGGGREEVSDDR